MAKGSCTLVYLPLCTYINPLWGMNEKKRNSSLSLNLSLSLSLFPFLNVEPPWEGAGAIVGTTPHPVMLLNAYQHIRRHCHHHPRKPFLSSSQTSSLSSLLPHSNPKTYNTKRKNLDGRRSLFMKFTSHDMCAICTCLRMWHGFLVAKQIAISLI